MAATWSRSSRAERDAWLLLGRAEQEAGAGARSRGFRGADDRLTTDIKGSPSLQADDGSQCAGTIGSDLLALPKDILYHIHALMPFRDAARAACLSREFLHSWRCYPKLILDIRTLGIAEDVSEEEKITRDFISRVDHIMQNHSGTGVKMIKLQTYPFYYLHPIYIDQWLQMAITPGIEELEVRTRCRFPCSILSSERGSSIRSFILADCAFHSTIEVGWLRSLKRVKLSSVHVTGDELFCFLSNCSALEELDLSNCSDIVFLKIPYLLSQLNFLQVLYCSRLQSIEVNSPKLSKFSYTGSQIHISLGESSQVKMIELCCYSNSNMIYYALTKLPSIAPNLQSLYLSSCIETFDTPTILEKFNHLEHLELEIVLDSPGLYPDFDFYSLAPFLGASPALETFILRVEAPAFWHDSVPERSDSGSSLSRCLPEHRYDKLRNMMITGFRSARSMIELTNHIIEKTVSLECLTLDTTRGYDKRYAKIDKCLSMSKMALLEAEKAYVAIRRHIQERVPSTVNLKVIGPCSKCHRLDKCYGVL